MLSKALPGWTKYAVLVAIVAVGVVVARAMADRANEAAWAVMADADIQQGSVEALEAARERVRGTDAEAQLTYLLAHRLYELGGEGNFERARQVLQEGIASNPVPPVAADFRTMLEALNSYRTAPAEQT